MKKDTIVITDEIYDALKTIHYALHNDITAQWPSAEMAKMHYRIACKSITDALREQGVELP